MKIVIAGGSGFLGQALVERLSADGHEIVVLSRSAASSGPSKAGSSVRRVRWDPEDGTADWTPALTGADAIVNLAGESIAGRRWSEAHKTRIRESRLHATSALVKALKAMLAPPAVFVSGSAIGYYGDREDEPLTETSAPGRDYLAKVCVEWETEASHAVDLTRVVVIRTGIVLDRRSGALPKMLPPFKMFVGGPLGSGQQYMSWIHRTDWVDLVRWAIVTDAARGPLNLTAPRPVTNADFSKALGRALGRPSWVPAPVFALRLLLGEMADALLLSGQKVLPQRSTALGFRFTYPEIDQALKAIFAG